jgi:hypothetical protein
MHYRPNYVSLGLFTPRGPAAAHPKAPATAAQAGAAMENEGGPAAKEPKAPPPRSRK